MSTPFPGDEEPFVVLDGGAHHRENILALFGHESYPELFVA